MSLEIEKPIFIIGSGRSGTTIFYSLLATHPDLCWFSNYSDRFLHFNFIPYVHRILDIKSIESFTKRGIIASRKFFIKPSEAGHIYHDYCGFRYNVRTTEKDISLESQRLFKDIVKRHLALTGKKRFLNKQTANNQRIRIIDNMFKDAYYIHVIRDGRAVANSYYHVRWWKETELWWLGEKTTEWAKKGKNPVELCALNWKHNVQEILDNKSLFGDRYMEVKYEDFSENVKDTLQKVCDFCGLNKSERFINLLPEKLYSKNYKWKENLTIKERNILEKTLHPFLHLLGYK